MISLPVRLANQIWRPDVETHFLAEAVGTAPTFSAEPWYNPYGDCIVYRLVDEAAAATES